ncbi:Uncharacterised protein [uncultured archaeon]|nr:Uncharacterised protein [uncultured archaeon]
MSNKFVLLLVLLSTTLFISGCITGEDSNKNNTTPAGIGNDMIPKTNLPQGFVYMATHEVSVPIGTSFMNATEGVYRNNGEDLYVQVIKSENPDAVIAQFRSRYANVKYIPFQEIYFNGHNATQVTDYTTINGNQKPHYTVIWPADKSVIIVGTSTQSQIVISLASATSH